MLGEGGLLGVKSAHAWGAICVSIPNAIYPMADESTFVYPRMHLWGDSAYYLHRYRGGQNVSQNAPPSQGLSSPTMGGEEEPDEAAGSSRHQAEGGEKTR